MYVCMCVCVYVRIRIHACKYVYMSIHVRVYIYITMYICTVYMAIYTLRSQAAAPRLAQVTSSQKTRTTSPEPQPCICAKQPTAPCPIPLLRDAASQFPSPFHVQSTRAEHCTWTWAGAEGGHGLPRAGMGLCRRSRCSQLRSDMKFGSGTSNHQGFGPTDPHPSVFCLPEST